MIFTLYKNSGKAVELEADFMMVEPEAIYLCNGEPMSWNRMERYYGRIYTDSGDKTKEGDTIFNDMGPAVTLVAKIKDVQTGGRRYWEYEGTWYSHVEAVTPPPTEPRRVIVQAPAEDDVVETLRIASELRNWGRDGHY